MTIRFINKWMLTLKKPGVWADVLQGNCKVFSSVKKKTKEALLMNMLVIFFLFMKSICSYQHFKIVVFSLFSLYILLALGTYRYLSMFIVLLYVLHYIISM